MDPSAARNLDAEVRQLFQDLGLTEKITIDWEKEITVNVADPTLDEWKELYIAAEEFRNLQPWTWMSDADLFGVQDPRSREVGYCCVLGALGEVFALCVYRGAEGLAGYRNMQAWRIGREIEDLPFTQKCLMASFEDRERLQKEDRDIIKKLGLKFRGRDSWPLFRSHLPGYFPWYVTRDEALFLTATLRQAATVARRFNENDDLLNPPEEDLVFTRIPAAEGEIESWRDDWVRPEPFERDAPEFSPVETPRLDRILRNCTPSRTTLEVDFFFFPAPVREGGRPFFPMMFLVMDHEKGVGLDTWLVPPWEFLAVCRERFLDFLERAQALPRRILVCRKDATAMLEPIAAALHVKVRLVKTLGQVRAFRNAMASRF